MEDEEASAFVISSWSVHTDSAPSGDKMADQCAPVRIAVTVTPSFWMELIFCVTSACLNCFTGLCRGQVQVLVLHGLIGRHPRGL